MTIDIDQLKADMAAGTKGPWRLGPVTQRGPQSWTVEQDILGQYDCTVIATLSYAVSGHSSNIPVKVLEYNARRIVCVPDLEAELIRLTEDNKRLRDALEWYGEMTRLCRLIHSEGDVGRNALERDGGKLARAALAEVTE